MIAPLATDILEDEVALSLARVVAAANKKARELGVMADQCLLTISQHPGNGHPLWRINYGPKNYVGRRGGDLILDVDPKDASIHRVLFGQ